MSAKPLAEAYEMLKELRRQGELQGPAGEQAAQTRMGQQLRSMNGGRGVPDRFADLIKRLDGLDDASAEALGPTTNAIRLLEIKPLAERIFGSEQIADAWLNRANPSFSGQKPIELLKDELGTAVVREALERIDYGIFS
jgi:Protein of unknown function (DUF2384)